MDLVKTADKVLAKYAIGSVEQEENVYLLTLYGGTWAKAEPALKELREISPDFSVYPGMLNERLVQYEYVIKKAEKRRNQLTQKLLLLHAAMMAANPEKYWMPGLANK